MVTFFYWNSPNQQSSAGDRLTITGNIDTSPSPASCDPSRAKKKPKVLLFTVRYLFYWNSASQKQNKAGSSNRLPLAGNIDLSPSSPSCVIHCVCHRAATLIGELAASIWSKKWRIALIEKNSEPRADRWRLPTEVRRCSTLEHIKSLLLNFVAIYTNTACKDFPSSEGNWHKKCLLFVCIPT